MGRKRTMMPDSDSEGEEPSSPVPSKKTSVSTRKVATSPLSPVVSLAGAVTKIGSDATFLPKIVIVKNNPSKHIRVEMTFVATRGRNDVTIRGERTGVDFSLENMDWKCRIVVYTFFDSTLFYSPFQIRFITGKKLYSSQWKIDYNVDLTFSSASEESGEAEADTSCPTCPPLSLSGTCSQKESPPIDVQNESWKPLVRLPAEGEESVETSVFVDIHFTITKMIGFRSHNRFSYDFTQANRDSDVGFKFGNDSVFLNCSLLSFHSEYFAATKDRLCDMKRDSHGFPIVEVEGVIAEEFIELMQIVYPSKHEVTDENVEYILVLADRFGFEGVLENCEKFLMSTESVIEVITKLHWSSQYSMTELQGWCLAQFKTRTDFDRMRRSNIYKNCHLSADVLKALWDRSFDLPR